MAKCKCKICGEPLDTKTAYKVVVNGKNAYYCSAAEHENDLAKKEKAAADKDNVYRSICDILSKNEITNSVLWKEKAEWNKAFSDELIAQYLNENKEYLTSAIAKLENKEYNRIRYLSAIIKNSLGDYTPKPKVEIQKVIVEETIYEAPSVRRNQRRSLADLEDEY
jgi:YHS domain-containing protein